MPALVSLTPHTPYSRLTTRLRTANPKPFKAFLKEVTSICPVMEQNPGQPKCMLYMRRGPGPVATMPTMRSWTKRFSAMTSIRQQEMPPIQ